MNKTALLLLKWIKQKKPKSTHESCQYEARRFWERYGEKIIRRALHQKSCTSIPNFIDLCSYYLKHGL